MEVRVSDTTPPGRNISENQESESENNPNLSIGRDTTIGAAPEFAASDSTAQPAPPQRRCIGNYELVRKLGQGGMGQVWLAEQTAPIRREVALKLIKAGVCDESRLHRFQSERQYLAPMDHPCIAKVFDAGATPDGQPYLVMERIVGLPITEYCDQKKLKIRERLELFMKVCDGVQHAHQKAIIHRDLKPANILVIEVDGQPAPRIIDFGLAKAVRPSTDGETVESLFGNLAGTPGYLSPEQIDAGAGDIDTRTDVYSLGAVLYVLLTGALPFDPKEWRNKPLDFFLRQVREQDPPRPSTRIGMQNGSASCVASLRAAKPKELAHYLRGDIDCITMKALERNRVLRYGTPSELAADIGRCLHSEPVVARTASAGYRARKYIRRHRLGVGVAATILLLLAGFAVAQAAQLRRITRERDRANRITDFMTRIFKVSDPSESRGNTVTAREILDTASKQIDRSLPNDPELQAEMMNTMGIVYENLGLYSSAQPLLERALEIRRRVLGSYSTETLRSMRDVGSMLLKTGSIGEAEQLDREALAAERRVLGPNRPETLVSMTDLAAILGYEGHYQEAEKLQREALSIEQRVMGTKDLDTLRSMYTLAAVLNAEHKYADAEQVVRQALEVERPMLGNDHPYTLSSSSLLGNLLIEQHQYASAETVIRQTIDTERRILGPDDPSTLISTQWLASALEGEGHYSEAEKLMQSVLASQIRTAGPDSPDAAESTYFLATIAAAQHKREEAFALLRHAIDHGLAPTDIVNMESDDDLKSLHGDPRFAALVTYAKRRVAAAQKPK
jgi:eukaryotic-like serine/threonine-protein kinase